MLKKRALNAVLLSEIIPGFLFLESLENVSNKNQLEALNITHSSMSLTKLKIVSLKNLSISQFESTTPQMTKSFNILKMQLNLLVTF
jgi:hypothetical protein